MNDDKMKKDSGLSQDGESPRTDRFDVLDSVEFDDFGEHAGKDGGGEKAGDVESTLDELISELDDLNARAEENDDTLDFSDLASAANFKPSSAVRKDDPTDAPSSETAAAAPKKSAAPKPGDSDLKSAAPKADGAKSDASKSAAHDAASPKAPERKPTPAPKRKDPLEDTGTIEFDHGAVPERGAAKKPSVPAAKSEKDKTDAKKDADRAADTISSLIEAGKLSAALDLVLCLRGAFRQAVREKAHVTIPLGSRDSDLRRIAAGALIQSYLEQGKIVRRDIENKLYAIIESSEPEYDEHDEIIEQTEDDVLYKVTACMVFAAELTEKSGDHPDEKSAMYASGDSVLDQFLADNLDEVRRTNKKRLAVLATALSASRGEVAEKFDSYYSAAKKSGESPVSKFFGDSVAFKVAAAVVGFLCFVTLVLYLFKFPSSAINARLINLVAKENSPIMLFLIAAEIFAIVGLAILCVIVGFSGKSKDGANRHGRR